jgi:superkiller protein 3
MERIAQAAERAREAARLAPEEHAYAQLLGELLYREGQWAAAAGAFRNALRHKPDDAMLYVSLGRAERQQRLWDAAVDKFRLAIRKDDQLAIAHHLLADTILDQMRPFMLAKLAQAPFPPADPVKHQGLVQEAIDAARRACAIGGRETSYHATLARALLLAEQPGTAMSALRQLEEAPEHRLSFLTLAGIGSLQRGDMQRARMLFEQATRLDPRNPVAWIGLARVFEQAGDSRGALAAAERAQTLKPDESIFHFALARISRDLNDLLRAREEMEQAVKSNPTLASWHHELAGLRHANDDDEAALAAYDTALDLLPSDGRPGSAQEEAKIRFARGRLLFQLDRPTDAIREMESAIERDAARHEWHSELAEHLMEMGRPAEAQNWLRSAIGHAPDLPAYPIRLAEAQAACEEWEPAVATLRSACSRWPDHVPAWRMLGSLFLEQGDLDGAQEVLTHALSLSPGDAGTHVVLGEVYLRQNELEKAREAFQQALTLDPDNATAHVHMGRLYDFEGLLDKAMDSYHRALRIDPEHLQAHFYIGRLCHREGHYNKATIHLTHVVRAAPHSFRAWAALAACAEDKREPEVALKYYERANEVADGREYYHFEMGRLLREMHRYDDAIPVLRKAVKVDPQNTEAYKMLAAVSAIVFLGGRKIAG